MLEKLTNSGTTILNNVSLNTKDDATIIVCGIARSGTSMIGAVLHALGVYLGETFDQAVFEDVELSKALEKDSPKLTSIIARNDQNHRVWAFKRPSSFRLITSHLSKFRGPRLVVIFRDPLAIAKRNEISMKQPLLPQLAQSALGTVELANFVTTSQIPTFLVSYEKALFDPPEFVKSLIQFCGLEASDSTIENAVKAVRNGPEVYLRSSQIRTEGSFDRCDDFAHGWAVLIPSAQPATVIIKANGLEVGRGIAGLSRPDLLAAGIGNAAFKIKLPENLDLNAKLEAFVNGFEDILPRRF